MGNFCSSPVKENIAMDQIVKNIISLNSALTVPFGRCTDFTKNSTQLDEIRDLLVQVQVAKIILILSVIDIKRQLRLD